jgi:hypothetical protein
VDGPALVQGDGRRGGLLRTLLLGLAFWIACLGGRIMAGATSSSFGAYEDEPAHLVTGLMIRDFLQDGELDTSRQFAEEYYAHSPKVAFGQWPPVLHGALGLWTYLFGHSRFSLVAMCSLVTALAALLTRALLRQCGAQDPLPTIAGWLFLALPLVQEYAGLIMTEGPLALTCGFAVLGLARLLERDDWVGAMQFAAGAIAALLIKGLALALALLPLAAILLAWRWERLRSKRLWTAALLIGVFTAPWYLAFYRTAIETWSGGSSPTWGYAAYALGFYPRALWELGGSGFLALVLVGFAAGVMGAEKRTRWCVYLAWTPALFGFLATIPSSAEARHLILAAPVLACAATLGAWFLAGKFTSQRRLLLTLTILMLAYVPMGMRFPGKRYRGFEEVALRCLSDPELAAGPFLVASDAAGEGMLVSEFLMRRSAVQSPYVLRGSKLLGSGNWLGHGYEPRFENAQALEEFLISLPVSVLVIDGSTKSEHWFGHMEQLKEMVRRQPSRWREVARVDVERDGVLHAGAMQLFELRGHAQLPHTPITFRLARGADQRDH